MYRLVMADDDIPKNLMPTDTNLRTPAKDVLANRVYACAICDDTFRLKSDFREHVYRTHLEVTKNRETPNASCINCNESFTDSAVRRRHFNNLDCIVYIVCNTCGEQFSTQAIYLEHCYQTHLKSQDGADGADEILFEEPDESQMQNLSGGSGAVRSVQKCPVCHKQYNNYYNVLRHMEAKHPDQVPQTYQCPECPDEKFSKQTYLRDHLIKVHNKEQQEVSPRQLMQHQIGNQSSQKLPAYVCKIADCGMEFRERAKWLDHQIEQHEGQLQCMFCDHNDDDRESFESHLEAHQNQLQNDSDDENNASPSKTDAEQTKSFKCRQCSKRIATKTGLQKHMIKVHNVGGELVKCTLCPADFANDKGLKVHLWRCHEIREADYENVLPPDLLDPYKQQQRKFKQEEEQKSMILANESGVAENQKTYECPLCYIVYTSRTELADHQKSIHAMDDVDVLEADEPYGSMMQEDSKSFHVTGDDESHPVVDDQEYWFQCRFCQRCFNSSKKLTIHMNSHQEGGGPLNGQDEHGGYPCKECSMVYKSKKSLWVHRHKKHPRIPEPSPCDACEKVFFDKNELLLHMQHVHPGSIPAISDSTAGENESFLSEGHWLLDSSDNAHAKPVNQLIPNSVPKKRKRPAPSETPDGQFACDMCPKAFSNANALQVHRGWHFRSPDGRKVTNPSQMWMPDQVPPSKVRRTTTSTPIQIISPQANPVCPHCDTKFASHNNLRRHIIEVHKKSASGEDLHDGSDDAKLDRVGECTACDVTFSTVAEWVDHKINDARVKKSSITPSSGASSGGGYEWNCEICMRIFTRKERLIQHMLSHLNDREMDPEVLEIHAQQIDIKTEKINGEETYENESSSSADEEEEDEDEDEVTEEEVKPTVKSYSCELCQVDFGSSQELRSHVADHFLNGGVMETTRKPVVKEESDVELDIEDLDLEEAQVDYQQATTSQDEDSSSDDDSSSPEEEPAPPSPPVVERPPLPKIQVQVHRCRVCNAAFLDSSRSVECMMNHQKPTSFKCSECQLFFIGSKHLQDHEKLCH